MDYWPNISVTPLKYQLQNNVGTLVHGGIWRRGLRSCRAAGASEAEGISSEAPATW